MTTPILNPQTLVSAISTFSAIVEPEIWVQPPVWSRMMRHQLGVSPLSRWDAALVQHCGYWSHYDHATDRSAWPIAGALVAADFATWGQALGLLREDPMIGDILLQYSPLRRCHVRAGVVVRVLGWGSWSRNRVYVDVLSVEGDLGVRGQLGGAEVMRVRRRLWPRSKDTFLRWWEAGSNTGAQNPAGAA